MLEIFQLKKKERERNARQILEQEQATFKRKGNTKPVRQGKDILARKMAGTGIRCHGFNAVSAVSHCLPSSSLSQSLSAFDRSEKRIKAFDAKLYSSPRVLEA